MTVSAAGETQLDASAHPIVRRWRARALFVALGAAPARASAINLCVKS
jgi:hypothetical protein